MTSKLLGIAKLGIDGDVAKVKVREENKSEQMRLNREKVRKVRAHAESEK